MSVHDVSGGLGSTAEASKIRRMNIGLLGSAMDADKAVLHYAVPQDMGEHYDLKALEGALAKRLSETIGGSSISIANHTVEHYGQQAFEVTLSGQSLLNFREFERTQMKSDTAIAR